jgi:hypothetical protein
MLSGDNYAKMSDVFAEDTSLFFKQLSGNQGSTWENFMI